MTAVVWLGRGAKWPRCVAVLPCESTPDLPLHCGNSSNDDGGAGTTSFARQTRASPTTAITIATANFHHFMLQLYYATVVTVFTKRRSVRVHM